MEHIAILNKSWKFLESILSGEKTIESRWYKTKRAPYSQIGSGETVYFKNSGEPVTAKAKVEKVLEFSNLNPEIVDEILKTYGDAIGICKKDIPKFREQFKDKKYCILMFLKNSEKINSFEIDKKGYGLMSAWMCVDNIRCVEIIKEKQRAL